MANNICFNCVMSPLNYIFQAHRWYYFKCEQNERGECENIFKIRPINVTMWLIAFSAGLYAIYYFLQKTIYGNLNDYFMLKINLTAFICALLSIGNSVMWNLKRDTLKILGLTSFRVYRKYFSRKEDVSLKKDVKIMSVFFWLFHFIGMLLNIFIMIFTRCDYIFWQVSNWICINYFSCLFFELDIFINVLVIYGEKLQKYIKNLKFETCDRKLMSKIFDTILYELNSFHRMYFSFVEMMYYIEDYLSLIVPLGFICIIPILVLICCAFFDVIIYPLKTSKDDIMLLASITGFGAPWVGYAGITILKLDKLKNMGENIISILFQYRINKLTSGEAFQVENLIASIEMEKPVIKVSNFFILGTGFISSVIASVITYILVALQFQIAWMKN